ncbi:bifunctional serine/threonine-protein kinase/ABC transporter substrate-binding protein [Streptomyces sp. NBC_01017]|uniref:bifunctional serine/threonine-protein kinase/ABC transporter substrate-binding protein n=1 Tax=Streptomyces sp. NBC_01017 TaxID=2903721 RepID=UPI003864C6FC|nr:bifunctional serine/threonine-protein kinase/ABC transporter substrate-binding protein [Streptomyces sp. NBC_01017]WSV35048.1 bifunctional serine/threonine-protein kinase/ABC transporter substrate-binding protein [Streptomyces sp. NBC_01017]
MEPLRTSDPARLAGYRLLGRLGAGGMGVVYLARSDGAAVVALKVIQAEYAEDSSFRERFRREADTARRMTGPWVAAVVDADSEAAQPWLATAFVPGPSLAEAVAAHGPLPVRSVQVLGARLAEALKELHSAGLVHRDVKPANVLLALDGPRLIDFGVARDPQDTSLTSTGVVVGTPGFLPPEQATGGQTPGRAGDVFSLGCVLAFSATGRPPFGYGSLEALLYRTVHEVPDLDGLAPELTEMVSNCLNKDPQLRPPAETLADALAATVWAPGPDPREALRATPPMRPEESAPGEPGQLPDAKEQARADEAWLPEPLIRLIAERSAAGLALASVEATEVSPAPFDNPTADAEMAVSSDRAVSRRRLLLAGGAAVVAAGGGLATWAALGRGDNNQSPGQAATGAVYTLGLHGDLTGDHKAVGRAQERGLRLAVEQFNARASKPFTLAVKTVDDGGDSARAPQAAKEMAADRSVLAVIGPTTDATALTTLATYDAAALPLIAVSPGATALGVMGSRTLLHARVTDTVLSFYLDAYLRGTTSRTVGIVDDRAADAYAWEISSTLANILRDQRRPAVPKVVSALRTDFAPVLDALLHGGADSVVFAGQHDRAALMARELSRRGFSGARAGAQGVLDARFLSAASAAADGWVIVAPVMDAVAAPTAKAFTAAYRKHFDAEPERYAVEAYDVAQLAVRTLRSLTAARRTRQNLTAALRSATHQGISRNLAFDKKTGTLVIDGSGVYLWKVDGGRFVYQGAASYQSSSN